MMEREAEIMGKEKNCRLQYNISEDKWNHEMNENNYDKMKKTLQSVGIWFDIEDGVLSLAISDNYNSNSNRNAGRKKKCVWNTENGKCDVYRYSDIVYMMQFMMDQQIAEKIEMPIATYYRHKKKLKESAYYDSLDLNKLKNKEYLEGVDYNFVF